MPEKKILIVNHLKNNDSAKQKEVFCALFAQYIKLIKETGGK